MSLNPTKVPTACADALVGATAAAVAATLAVEEKGKRLALAAKSAVALLEASCPS